MTYPEFDRAAAEAKYGKIRRVYMVQTFLLAPWTSPGFSVVHLDVGYVAAPSSLGPEWIVGVSVVVLGFGFAVKIKSRFMSAAQRAAHRAAGGS